MTYEERLQRAVYRSPSGVETAFAWDEIREQTPLQRFAHGYPGAAGVTVQDLGLGGRRFAWQIFITGPDYDQAARAFLDSAKERGAGRLTHPFYGALRVVPFGSLARRDEPARAGGQAIIDVEFLEESGAVIPGVDPGGRSRISALLGGVSEVLSAEVESVLQLESVTAITDFKSDVEAKVSRISAAMRDVTAAQADLRSRFDATAQSIRENIDGLVNDPATLVQQLGVLTGGARSLGADAVASYRGLVSDVIADIPATPAAYIAADTVAQQALSDQANAALTASWPSAPAAQTEALLLMADLMAVIAWRDEHALAQGVLRGDEGFVAVQRGVIQAAAYVMQSSFDLAQERVFVTDAPATPVDLCWRLTGSLDGLDDFIGQNDFGGSEVFSVPLGRRVVAYV